MEFIGAAAHRVTADEGGLLLYAGADSGFGGYMALVGFLATARAIYAARQYVSNRYE